MPASPPTASSQSKHKPSPWPTSPPYHPPAATYQPPPNFVIRTFAFRILPCVFLLLFVSSSSLTLVYALAIQAPFPRRLALGFTASFGTCIALAGALHLLVCVKRRCNRGGYGDVEMIDVQLADLAAWKAARERDVRMAEERLATGLEYKYECRRGSQIGWRDIVANTLADWLRVLEGRDKGIDHNKRASGRMGISVSDERSRARWSEGSPGTTVVTERVEMAGGVGLESGLRSGSRPQRYGTYIPYSAPDSELPQRDGTRPGHDVAGLGVDERSTVGFHDFLEQHPTGTSLSAEVPATEAGLRKPRRNIGRTGSMVSDGRPEPDAHGMRPLSIVLSLTNLDPDQEEPGQDREHRQRTNSPAGKHQSSRLRNLSPRGEPKRQPGYRKPSLGDAVLEGSRSPARPVGKGPPSSVPSSAPNHVSDETGRISLLPDSHRLSLSSTGTFSDIDIDTSSRCLFASPHQNDNSSRAPTDQDPAQQLVRPPVQGSDTQAYTLKHPSQQTSQSIPLPTHPSSASIAPRSSKAPKSEGEIGQTVQDTRGNHWNRSAVNRGGRPLRRPAPTLRDFDHVKPAAPPPWKTNFQKQ